MCFCLTGKEERSQGERRTGLCAPAESSVTERPAPSAWLYTSGFSAVVSCRAGPGPEAELSSAWAHHVPQCPLAICCRAQVTLFFQLVTLLFLTLFISSKVLKSFWEVTEGLEKQTIAILQ